MILSAWALFAGWLHLQPKFRPSLAWFKNAESRLNHHLAVLFGFSSIAWAGHLVHVAIPEARGQHVGWDNFLSVLPHPARPGSLLHRQLGRLRPESRHRLPGVRHL
jgi:photosystem I P700 chlorophyll a apoprotein A2